MNNLRKYRETLRAKAHAALGKPPERTHLRAQSIQLSPAELLELESFDPGYEIQLNDGTFDESLMPGYDDPTT